MSDFETGDITPWESGFDIGDSGGYDPRLDPSGIDFGGYNPTDPGGPGGGSPDSGGGGGISLKWLTDALGGAGKGLGLFDKNGNINWAALMSALALGGGAAYGINRTNKANDQMQEAIKNANAQITSTLGGSGALYKPYQDAGALGLQRMMNQPQSNLAARYRPLGTGAGLSLGNLAKGQ